MMKVAYICEPHVGGLFSFFRAMRKAFIPHGIDYRCIATETEGLRSPDLTGRDEGVDFLPASDDLPTRVQRVVDHLVKENFKVVHVVPGNSSLANALPFCVPQPLGVVAKIPHCGRGAYLPAQFLSDYLDVIVPVNYGLSRELETRYRVKSSKIRTICIGVRTEGYASSGVRKLNTPVVLCSVGRLVDAEKYIFLLPPILKQLIQRGVSCRMVVAGSGPDGEALRKRFQSIGLEEYVSLPGALSESDVANLVMTADVFLMPSRFEGCPHALIEAMAAGCVPVVSRLKGTLDTMIEDGQSGYLCQVGDAGAFASRVESLVENPVTWGEMSVRAVETARTRYDISLAATHYAEVFSSAIERASSRPKSFDSSSFPVYRDPLSRIRGAVPVSLKNRIRSIAARFGRSI